MCSRADSGSGLHSTAASAPKSKWPQRPHLRLAGATLALRRPFISLCPVLFAGRGVKPVNLRGKLLRCQCSAAICAAAPGGFCAKACMAVELVLNSDHAARGWVAR